MNPDLDRLRSVLASMPGLAVAVSGGVDSLTLAHVASAVCPDFEAVHAVSPAVPASATERVRRHAKAHRWRFRLIETGEFADTAYLKNPVDRCYYCKSNLYRRMREVVGSKVIASGTNLDDLEDYRPGLNAASETGVVHPFVLAGIGKAALRGIARSLALVDIAELPAQPCLASRVETGIAIDATALGFIDRVEAEVRQHIANADVRCRITPMGVRLETSEQPPEAVLAVIAAWCESAGKTWLGLSEYRRGSAFKHGLG
ncbi:adenine nucleotide alpha hydrolase [Telmatospirillum siberiense]|uniref:Adenine nucleotide alpha hydrolase n=2 Tax=Telmatospirillum siberiense TaxID=382514 RepID=A0A2N3PWV3_9PROT|nr:adenine nucleotide alpha hydrolase [Telmatospirillum siberiense]